MKQLLIPFKKSLMGFKTPEERKRHYNRTKKYKGNNKPVLK